MIEAPRKYQATFFADTENLRPSITTIPPLLKAFEDRGLLPTTYSELAFEPAQSTPLPKFVPRLRLASSDNEWLIDFDRGRINIEKNSIKISGANLGSVEAFTQDAFDFLRRILALFPKKGNRLALVVNESLLEAPDDQLNEMYSRVLVPIDFFQENRAASWNSRSHTRIPRNIGAAEESLNVILRVDRIQGEVMEEGMIVPRDRIDIEIDVNTYQLNRDYRFMEESAQSFFSEANNIRKQILSSLKVQLHV